MKILYLKFTRHLVFVALFFFPYYVFANNRSEIPDTSAKAIYMTYMDNMMAAMDKQASTVSPEVDFLQQMIPHHQGAIVMANYEIKHGKQFEMIQLAKSIATEQQSEITLMQKWLQSPSFPKTGLPANYSSAMAQTMAVMMDSMMSDSTTRNDDYAFAQIMLPHHQAAIDMARVLLTYSKDPKLTTYAKQLIADEEVEIEQMSNFLK